MSTFAKRRYAFSIAAALLAGCGGSQPPIGAPRAMPQAPAAAVRAYSGRSWMDAGAKDQDLLYVTNQNGLVNVYRYWQHTLVGVLTDFEQPMGECVDPSGNVYITDYQANKIVEYAHGAMKPT
ncbi:MAG TPA: hypothetical protein VGI19_13385 [Candidatus Cybelea sp.]|jgi:hypothetical protein